MEQNYIDGITIFNDVLNIVALHIHMFSAYLAFIILKNNKNQGLYNCGIVQPWGQQIINNDVNINSVSREKHSGLERFSRHSNGNVLVQFGLLLGNEVCCEAR